MAENSTYIFAKPCNYFRTIKLSQKINNIHELFNETECFIISALGGCFNILARICCFRNKMEIYIHIRGDDQHTF